MFTTIQGSAHDIAQVADKGVQLICTSPPYFGLRAYDGEQEIDWPEMSYSPMPGLPPIIIPAQRAALGLEKDPFAYIGHLILCLREWRRVLRDDGLCFVNLGDSYAASHGTTGRNDNGRPEKGRGWAEYDIPRQRTSKLSTGLKPKDLMQIPQRFALAAQADGWYLRSAMPWIKRNGMPESVTDRPASVIESIFMLAKSERYFFDAEAVKMPVAESSIGRLSQDIANQNGSARANGGAKTNGNIRAAGTVTGRNIRSSDWFFKSWQGLLMNESGDPLAMVVNPQPFNAAHFAVWPENLVEPIILAGTSARGCCPACGAPWRRVVEAVGQVQQRWAPGAAVIDQVYNDQVGSSSVLRTGTSSIKETTGWEPTCSCPDAGEPVPCVVLDPFSGSGTTLKVAVRLGRRAIGVDLSEKYLTEITEARMGAGVQMELSW